MRHGRSSEKELDWINIFEWRFPVLIHIHGWTLLTLVLLWGGVLVKTRVLHIWSPVIATTAVTISVHLYESVHALCQLAVQGHTGPIEINLVCLLGALAFLYVFNRNIQVLSSVRTIMFPFLLFVLSMVVLVSTGYFADYPQNIVFGIEWALSKVAASVVALSLFWREDYGQ